MTPGGWLHAGTSRAHVVIFKTTTEGTEAECTTPKATEWNR